MDNLRIVFDLSDRLGYYVCPTLYIMTGQRRIVDHKLFTLLLCSLYFQGYHNGQCKTTDIIISQSLESIKLKRKKSFTMLIGSYRIMPIMLSRW